MAESGVIYTGPDDLLERMPTLWLERESRIEGTAPTGRGDDSERGFAFQFRRDKGTVESCPDSILSKRIDSSWVSAGDAIPSAGPGMRNCLGSSRSC